MTSPLRFSTMVCGSVPVPPTMFVTASSVSVAKGIVKSLSERNATGSIVTSLECTAIMAISS